LYDEAFRRWMEDQLADPPEGVRRSLRRPSFSGFGAQAEFDDGPIGRISRAGWELIQWRDFDGGWTRQPFDRRLRIDALAEQLSDFVQLLSGPANPYDNLFYDSRLARQLCDDRRRTESVVGRDYDRLEAALIELALRDEEEDLIAAIPRAELDRFAAEHPEQLEVTARYRPQVIFLADGKNPWESFREAERMVTALRSGADFATLASERSTGPNADLGGALGLLTTNQMMAYDLELLRTVVELELGEISDPLRMPEAKLSNQPGSLKGGFLIVKLLERREPHTLDLEVDEAEIRRRFWSANGNAILRQRRDERLLEAGFRMLLQAGNAFAEVPAEPEG